MTTLRLHGPHVIRNRSLMLVAALIVAVGLYGGSRIARRYRPTQGESPRYHFRYTTHTSAVTTRRPRPHRCHNCFQSDYPTLIKPNRVCGGNSSKITLVILITTVPRSVEARRSIRRTWARFTHNNTGIVRYVFLFGAFWGHDQKIIDDEGARYDDILQGHFIDMYRHLSIKVLMGFRWVLTNCQTARFVMRAADDTYVNIPGVVHLLQEHEAMFTNAMAGHCLSAATPVRRRGHKWHVSLDRYPGVTYPPYCIGTTFMQTLTLTRDLVDKSKDVPFFELEDVYFGLVLKQLNATVVNIVGFDVQWSHARYHRDEHWYTLHDITPTHMLYLWYVEAKRHQVYTDFFHESEGKGMEI